MLGVKLGYLQLGQRGEGLVENRIDRGFSSLPCPNNFCDPSIYTLFRSTTSGGAGLSGFSAFGDVQGAMALGHDFGAQFNGELGGTNGAGGGDAAVHVFRGDPAIGLVGPLVDYRALGDAAYLRAALEGQFYWKDFTFYGNAGYQWADGGQDINVASGIVGCGNVSYYPTESLMLLAGGGGGTGEAAGYAQVEWQAFPQRAPAASFIAEGMMGTDDSAGAYVGFRYHFGAANSLEMRHRHELPLRDTLCGMEQFTTPGRDTQNLFVVTPTG